MSGQSQAFQYNPKLYPTMHTDCCLTPEQIEEIIGLSALLIAFLIVGISYGSAVKNMDRLGSYDKGKLFFALHAGINFWIFSALVLVVIVRVLNFLSQDLFIALLIAGVGALGVKQVLDAKSKNDLPETENSRP